MYCIYILIELALIITNNDNDIFSQKFMALVLKERNL